ncbi:MAG TPA: hypothetical protein VGK73_16370 [Polyangiaceae bacterium]
MTKRPLLFALTCSSLLACTSVSTLGTGTDSEEGGSPGSGGESDVPSSGGTLHTGGTAMSSGGATSGGGKGTGKGGASSSAGKGGTSSNAGQPSMTAGTTGMESGGEPATGGMGSTGGGNSTGGSNSTGGTDPIGAGGQPACVNTLDTNQGSDPPDPEDCDTIGETLKQEHDAALVAPELDVAPLAGTWVSGSGTSRVEVVLDALGKGTVRFGEASEFPEFEEGDETFLTGTDEDDAEGVLGLSHLRPRPGFAYSILADTGRGSEMSFHLLVMEAWEEWCAVQTPIASPYAKACYACMYDEGLYSFATCDGEPSGCFAGNQDFDEEQRVHCGRLELCLMPYDKVCHCNADGCFTNLGSRSQLTDYPFTLELDPVDTTVLRLASHSEIIPKVTHYLDKQE